MTDRDGPELTFAALLRAVRAAVKRGGCIVTVPARARADAEAARPGTAQAKP